MGNKTNHLILCVSSLEYIIPFFFLSRIRGFKLLREKNEYPRYYQNPDDFRNKFLLAKISRYRLFDGLILMTYNLKEFFVKNGYKGICEVIPMTVEIERFINISSLNDNNYITCVGSISGEKDGISGLIDAYYILNSKIPNLNIKLRLIGDISNEKQMRNLLIKVNSYNLRHKVIFTGLLDRTEIPLLLKNSKLLALFRPQNIQVEGGFPTKLGEYLSTGIPVVLTRVGEIERYLTDNVHAFICEPGNPLLFAEKMQEALSNYMKANEIGRNGFQLASEVFNYKIQGQRLNQFLYKLL